MGFFDSLLGLKTSDATQAAASAQVAANNRAAADAVAYLEKQYGAGRSDLTSNTGSAIAALGSGYGQAMGNVAGYGGQAQRSLGDYTNRAVGASVAGNDAFQPAATAGAGASTMLGNAYGLNGPSGTAAAQAAFQQSPGYQFALDQGTQAAQRAAAAGGMLGSGNTLAAVTKYATGLADQNYNTFLAGLSNLGTQGLTAATGQSTNDRTAASALSSAGSTAANAYNATGSALGTLGASGANQTAGQYSTLGQLLDSNQIGLGNQVNLDTMQTAAANSNLAMGAAQAQDSITNANNGIFSQLLLGTAASGNNPGSPGLLGFARSALKL